MDFGCLDRLRTVTDLNIHLIGSPSIAHLDTSYQWCCSPCDLQGDISEVCNR